MFRPDLPGPETSPRDRRQVVQQRPEERERGAEELPHLSPGAEQGPMFIKLFTVVIYECS